MRKGNKSDFALENDFLSNKEESAYRNNLVEFRHGNSKYCKIT